MSEQLWTVIVSSLSALLGSIAGFVAASIQASKSFQNQLKLEALKRTWEVEDSKRRQVIAVAERRCDQAEEFIGMVTEDFQNIRHAAIFVLQSRDLDAIHRRISEYAAWRDTVPKRVYAFGAVVGGLGSRELIESWNDQLYPAFERLTGMYKEICDTIERDQRSPTYALDLLHSIGSAYEDYNKGLGTFMSQLDKIRATS